MRFGVRAELHEHPVDRSRTSRPQGACKLFARGSLMSIIRTFSLFVVACFLVVILQPSQSGATATHSHTPATADASPPAEGSPVEILDGQVNSLGIYTYPDAYVGVALANSNQALTVYVAPSANDSVLEATIQADAQTVATTTGVVIGLSFASEPISQAGFAHIMNVLKSTAVERDGIVWTTTHLDAATDTLRVQLLAPSHVALTNLSRALDERIMVSQRHMVVTNVSYLNEANRLLQILLGPHVRVVGSAIGAPAAPRPIGREDSGAPWASGQFITTPRFSSIPEAALRLTSGAVGIREARSIRILSTIAIVTRSVMFCLSTAVTCPEVARREIVVGRSMFITGRATT